MELDEFKSQWNKIQEKEIEKQKLTTETLDKIIMKTSTTLTEIQQRNAYWSKLGKAVCSALIVVLLINLAMSYFMSYLVPTHSQIFNWSITSVIIMIIFAIVSMRFYKWLEEIFIININENLKEALARMIQNFKKYYLIYNIVYIFLFPAYYYAFIKLFMSYWAFSTGTILWVCGGLTIISFIINYWYYKIKYFKKIKALEDNLKELNS